MSFDTILLIIIIIYLLFLHNKKKIYIENFATTDDIKSAVKEVYSNDMSELSISLDFINKINNNNNLYISGDLNINANIYSNKNITTLKDNKTVASLNSMQTILDNMFNKPFTHSDNWENLSLINYINSRLKSLNETYLSTSDRWINLNNCIDNNSLVYILHENGNMLGLNINGSNVGLVVEKNNRHMWKISQF